MSTSVTWNGSSYSVPASGEVGWGALSNFLVDLGNNACVDKMTTAKDIIVRNASNATARLPTGLLGDVTASINSAVVTITIASPGVVSYTSHGFATGDKVFLTTTGALPTGLTASTTYYVTNGATNTFQFATTLANAIAGTGINTSGSQSGTHTCWSGGLTVPDVSSTSRGLINQTTQTIPGSKTFTGTTTVFGNGSGTNVVEINAGASAAARLNLKQNGSTIQQWELGTGGDLSLNKDGSSTTVYLKANYTGTYIEFPSGETTYTANFNTGMSTATNNFTVTARKFGKTVTLTFPEMKATATATTNTWSTSAAAITDTALRPAVAVIVACCIENNNSNVYTEPGFMIINTNGTLNLVRATNWTNTTTNCGVNPLTVTYTTAS